MEKGTFGIDVDFVELEEVGLDELFQNGVDLLVEPREVAERSAAVVDFAGE